MARPNRKTLAWGAVVLAAIILIVWGATLIVGTTSPTEEPYLGRPPETGTDAPGTPGD